MSDLLFHYERDDNDFDLEYDDRERESTATVRYIVSCTSDGTLVGSPVACDPEDAWAWAVSHLPSSFAGIPRKKIKVSEVVNEYQTLFTVDFEPYSNEEKDDSGNLINPVVSVTTTGKNERKYYSIDTVQSLLPASERIFSEIVEFKNGINVGSSGPEGVDVPARNFAWTEKWYFVKNTVSWAYLNTLGAYTGVINDAIFRGFPEQSVMFMGSDFAPDSGDYHIVTFHFQFNPGGRDTWVASFPEFDKKGWDYYWLYSVETMDPKAGKVKKPAQLNIEQVCKPKNFPELFLIGVDLPGTASIPLAGVPVIAS